MSLFNPEERQRQLDQRKRAVERHYRAVLASGAKREAEMVRNAADDLFVHENPFTFDAITRLKTIPVTIEEFLDSKEFLADQVEVWPALRKSLIETNPDVFVGQPPVRQVLMGGATGTGKTERTRILLAYRTYLLTCFHEPQRLYSLPPSTTLVGMFMSTKSGVTKRVLYQPFRAMFLGMPYVKRWVKYDRKSQGVLRLEGNIEILPALPSVADMVGQALILALIDEANFMLVVEESRRTAGPRGKGGYFDQAELTYRTLTRRYTGRFGRANRINLGCICAISSTRYKDDFLDRRMSQVSENQKRGIEMDVRVYREKQYDVQPDANPENEWFQLLVGTDQYGTKVLQDGERFPINAQVERVPKKYLADFLGDPEGALRDVLGIASAAIAPYISQRHKIAAAIDRGKQRDLVPWVTAQNVDLLDQGMPQIDEAALPPRVDRQREWFVHVDLSKNKDRCGIGMACVEGFVNVVNPMHAVETVPRFLVWLAISIQPHKTKELDPSEVRMWITLLKTHYGFNIRSVTFDGFASHESMVLLRKAGIMSRHLSVDINTEHYDYFKDVLYNDRVDMVDNPMLAMELANLEKNEKRDKVDHPPKGSKDVADAVVGAIAAAAADRKNRAEMSVSTEYQGPPAPAVKSRSKTVRRNIKRR